MNKQRFYGNIDLLVLMKMVKKINGFKIYYLLLLCYHNHRHKKLLFYMPMIITYNIIDNYSCRKLLDFKINTINKLL